MGTCKWCGKGGLFSSVDVNGLCKRCSPSVSLEITQRGRIVVESIDLINGSKNIETRIGRCDTATKHLKELIQYERHRIETTNPPPTVLLGKIAGIKTGLRLEAAIKNASKVYRPRSEQDKQVRANCIEMLREVKENDAIVGLQANYEGACQQCRESLAGFRGDGSWIFDIDGVPPIPPLHAECDCWFEEYILRSDLLRA